MPLTRPFFWPVSRGLFSRHKKDERKIIFENMKSLWETLRGGHNLESTGVKEAENLMQGQKIERKRIN